MMTCQSNGLVSTGRREPAPGNGGGRLLAALLAVLLVLSLTGCAARRHGQPSQANQQELELSLARGLEAYRQGDCRGGIVHFSEALRIQAHPAAWNGLGMSQLMCRQNREAVASLREAVSLAPNSPSLHTNLGSAYYATADYKRAGSEFETALRMDPANPEALVGKAGVLLEMDKPDQAYTVLRQVSPRDAQRPEVLFNRGLVLYRLTLYSDAETVLRQYLAAKPEDPDGHNALGVTLLMLKRHKEALASLDRAIALDSEVPAYYYNRGNVLKAMRKFAPAVDEYSRAIARGPDFAEAFVNRGDLRCLLRNTKEGCADLERACDLGLCERLESLQELGRCR